MSRRVPYVPQMEAVECGAACLASVLAAFGHHAPLSEVRELCKVGRDGATGADLLDGARACGLEAEAFFLEAEHLEDLPLPAILHWEFRHFVVLERLTRTGVWLVDPARGRIHATRAELGRAFTGVALCFDPGEAFAKRPTPRLSLHRYLDLLRPLRASLGQVLLASLLLQSAALVLPLGTQLLVDRVLLGRQTHWIWGLGLALGLAVLAQAAVHLLRGVVLQNLKVRLDDALMRGFVRHLARLPLAFFLLRHPGDLLQRMESNSALRDLFSSRSLSALMDACLVLGSGALMLQYSPLLGSLVLLLAGLRVGLLALLRRAQAQAMAGEMAASGREQSLMVEALTGLETLKAAGAQAQVAERWTHRLVQRLNQGQARLRLSSASAQAMVLVQGLAMALVLGAGGREVLLERMTLGAFTAFMALQQIFMSPLESLLGALSDFHYLATHLARLDDILESPVEPTGDLRPCPLQGDIRLEGLSFRYSEGAPWVLRDIDLHLRPGEKIALVGRTGAGKSTLARILLGMHPPTEGRVRYDGHDLRDLDLDWVRRQLGVVPQESILLDDTPAANLALGREGITAERMREAAALAAVADVLDALPEGWDTRLGERGCRLSGGERQRLCLARALVARPAILLLDEATSALDLETEAKVHAGLAALGCTRILIAHRLETVKDADRILVLEEGRLVQTGTFESLSGEAGPFREAVLAMEAGRG